MNMGVTYMQLKQLDAAREHLEGAMQQTPKDPNVEYNLACYHAAAGNKEDALKMLKSAVSHGFSDAQLLRKEPDLKSLRGDPGFQAAVQAVSAKMK